MLGWLVYEHGIEPHVTVFDKSTRQAGIVTRWQGSITLNYSPSSSTESTHLSISAPSIDALRNVHCP
jgi:hypothetical protein